jgi:rifampin ADP-ribosylating transferase
MPENADLLAPYCSNNSRLIPVYSSMLFSPTNPIVQLCLRGMGFEEQAQPAAAEKIFRQAWDQAGNEFEKYLSAYYIARVQTDVKERLKWTETAFQLASGMDDPAVLSALPALCSNMAACYRELEDVTKAEEYSNKAIAARTHPRDAGPFYHGTKAELKTGDLLRPGFNSNYKANLLMNHIYFTAQPDGAGLAAALAQGNGPDHVYIVEPTGAFESDPNVTDQKFPGNPTRSYRTDAPLKIVAELTTWNRQSPEQIRQWKEKLAKSSGEIIN